ncbi:MAG: hypothetical protein NVS9B9_29680 [Ktedonobacteraceae bacterium]
MKLLCSTGAFSRSPDYIDHRAALRYGPQLDVDGLELMFYAPWYEQIEQIAHDLQQSGLRFPVMHTEKNIGVALGKSDAKERERGVQWLSENCRLAKLLGTKILVLHLWGWPELDDHLENNLSLLSQCLDITEQYGQTLALETIPCRHADPLSNVQHAIEQDNRCHVALDTEFLAQSNQLDEVFTSPWLWSPQRIQHTHIKDFAGHLFTPDGGRKYLHPGEGIIDFAQFLDRLRQCNYDGYVSLESPAIDMNGLIDIERLQKSVQFIKKLIYV